MKGYLLLDGMLEPLSRCLTRVYSSGMSTLRLIGVRIEGQSAVRRATVRLLSMNDARRLELRQLIESDRSR